MNAQPQPIETSHEAFGYEEAKRLALETLLRQADGPACNDPAIVESETIERPWGWILFWNTRLFAETGDFEHALVGQEPLCINRRDRSVTPLINVQPLDRQIRRYERRIGFRPWWKFW